MNINNPWARAGCRARFLLRLLSATLTSFVIIILLAGCAAESTNPLAVEKLNGDPPKQEKMSLEIDCRGVVNGVFQPGSETPYYEKTYPVNYSGDWYMPYYAKSKWYMITSDEPGARVDIVATMSRVVINFWDYDFYDNPGKVKFLVDDKPIGSFDLDRESSDGQKMLTYQITTQKNTVATVSMILESGRVTVFGYLISCLDENFLY